MEILNSFLNSLPEEIKNFALIALAALLGGLIGFERELSDKPAGLRTHIFVAAGAALLMILGDAILDKFQETESNRVITADPIRVVQAIVVGISFLGAGTIIHQGGQRVEGLTTAASIFLTAGMGIAVAVDRIILAVATSIFAVCILFFVGAVERRLMGKDKDDEEAKGEKTEKASGPLDSEHRQASAA